MDEMGYDVVEYDGGIYEQLIHTPHGTEVWCYPHWQIVKREVVDDGAEPPEHMTAYNFDEMHSAPFQLDDTGYMDGDE